MSPGGPQPERLHDAQRRADGRRLEQAAAGGGFDVDDGVVRPKGLGAFVAACIASAAISALVVLLFSFTVDSLYELALANHWLALTLPAMGLLAYAVYRLFKIPYGVSTPSVVASVGEGHPVPVLLAPAIFIGSSLSIAGAGSVGKEAAALQIGAAIASKVSCVAKVAARLRETVVLSGMAAAFSVLLGAPFAAMLFVFELVGFRGGTWFKALMVLVSAVVAQVLARSVQADRLETVMEWQAFSPAVSDMALLTMAIVVAAAVYCLGLKYGKRLTASIPGAPFTMIVVSGVAYAAVMLHFGYWDCIGTGMVQTKAALAGQVDDPLFMGKTLATVVLLASGFKGGEIMPMLCIGATLGSWFGWAMGLDPACCAAVSIVAFMAACTNCPLASVVFAFELFGPGGLPWCMPVVLLAFVLTARVSLYDNFRFADVVKRGLRRLARPDAES